jgi:hypothetical protein
MSLYPFNSTSTHKTDRNKADIRDKQQSAINSPSRSKNGSLKPDVRGSWKDTSRTSF